MAIARFKDLCIDAARGDELGRFWSAALRLDFEADELPDGAGSLAGPLPTQRVWMNVVPEEKSAKHRVHLDVHAASVDELVALGATVLEPLVEGRRWTVMADPQGGEFCAFVRAPDKLPDYRLYAMVIDCVEPREIATWWADVLGAKLGGDEAKGWWWIDEIPGLPFDSWDFVPVPEPKTVKNRVHWDVVVDSTDDLVAAGAAVLAEPTETATWTVMADPEGNEFCAFVKKS